MKSKLSVLVLSMTACASAAVAQNVTTPYSMYGYGILGDRATSMQRQMGSVGYAMRSGRQINVMNPASYASIDSLTFLFDIGADVTFLNSKEGSAKEHSVGGGLDYITMQFPISKHFGGSVGLLPYTSVGYAFGNDIEHGTRTNQGSGGINMAYVGFAGYIKGFSLGFNVSYDFGSIVNDIYSSPSASGRTLFEHVMQIRDWNINLGVQYSFPLTKTERMTLGFTYTPRKTLRGKTWATIQEMSLEKLPTTVASGRLNGNYYRPNSYGAGIAFTHERTSRITAEVDFSYEQWADVPYPSLYDINDPEELVFAGMNFNNRWRAAAGLEYVPRIRGNYGQRMAYRIGGYYTNDYLKIGSNGVREYGVTLGVGLHTPQDKTMINIGLEWKHRQAHPSPLIKENYLNITLGVNFNELWFYQRKIK